MGVNLKHLDVSFNKNLRIDHRQFEEIKYAGAIVQWNDFQMSYAILCLAVLRLIDWLIFSIAHKIQNSLQNSKVWYST